MKYASEFKTPNSFVLECKVKFDMTMVLHFAENEQKPKTKCVGCTAEETNPVMTKKQIEATDGKSGDKTKKSCKVQ